MFTEENLVGVKHSHSNVYSRSRGPLTSSVPFSLFHIFPQPLPLVSLPSSLPTFSYHFRSGVFICDSNLTLFSFCLSRGRKKKKKEARNKRRRQKEEKSFWENFRMVTRQDFFLLLGNVGKHQSVFSHSFFFISGQRCIACYFTRRSIQGLRILIPTYWKVRLVF